MAKFIEVNQAVNRKAGVETEPTFINVDWIVKVQVAPKTDRTYWKQDMTEITVALGVSVYKYYVSQTIEEVMAMINEC